MTSANQLPPIQPQPRAVGALEGVEPADLVPALPDSGLSLQDTPPLSSDEEIINLNEELVEDKKYTGYLPQIVKAAHRFGYIRYGWNLYDYLYAAVKGDPNISQSKGGWEDVAIWGKQGGGKCLPGESLVATPYGSRKLKALRPGDEILGFKNGRMAIGRVLACFKSHRPLLEISANRQRICSSPEHAFLTNRGWLQAKHLRRGDKLQHIDVCCDHQPFRAQGAEVQSISRADEEEELYDIATTLGNYIAEDTLVHNSNLSMQLMFILYQDWDWVLKRMILTAREVLDLYKETQANQGRVPIITLDDITTIFPKQLWFVSKDMFITLQQFIATIRMRFANILSSTPLPQNLISSIKENVTFEVITYPQSSYMVERYAWLTDLSKLCVANLKKIYVEYSSFDIYEVPGDVWKQYEDRRWEVTETIVSKMEETLKALDAAMGGRESDDEVADAPDPEHYIHISMVMKEQSWSPSKAMRELRKGYLRNVKFQGTYYVLREDYERLLRQQLMNDKTGGARGVA